jgi:hypothetical protein
VAIHVTLAILPVEAEHDAGGALHLLKHGLEFVAEGLEGDLLPEGEVEIFGEAVVQVSFVRSGRVPAGTDGLQSALAWPMDGVASRWRQGTNVAT